MFTLKRPWVVAGRKRNGELAFRRAAAMAAIVEAEGIVHDHWEHR